MAGVDLRYEVGEDVEHLDGCLYSMVSLMLRV